MTTTDGPVETRALTDMTRDELNHLAETSGIDEPDRLSNKVEVIAAIEVARSGPGTMVLVGDGAGNETVTLPAADEPVVYRFTGDGSIYYAGVPAANLTQREADRIAVDRPGVFHAMTSAPVGATPLYERVEEPS